jgi:hypothetical protein
MKKKNKKVLSHVAEIVLTAVVYAVVEKFLMK